MKDTRDMTADKKLKRHGGKSDTRSKRIARPSTSACEALPAESIQALRDVISRHSSGNPWTNAHVRIRNEVVMQLFLQLGLRRGEVLGIKIPEIHFEENFLAVGSGPQCSKSRSATQADRQLPVSDDLIHLIREYICGARSEIKGSKRHDYLIVSDRTGVPLTNEGLNRVFETLRKGLPDLLSGLTAHGLRLNWNLEFLRVMEKRGANEEDVRRLRCHYMGWSDLKTADLYDRWRFRDNNRRR